jgi:CRISPR-associated protein Cas2
MYVLVVYDVSVERVSKVHKCLKRFLHWRQNSVFEGELTDARIEAMKADLDKIIVAEADSVLLYIARDEKWLKREFIGKQGKTTDNFV